MLLVHLLFFNYGSDGATMYVCFYNVQYGHTNVSFEGSLEN